MLAWGEKMNDSSLSENEACLLDCFIAIAKTKGSKVAKKQLIAEIQLRDVNISPASLVEIGNRFSLSVDLATAPLAKIKPAILPILLVMNDQSVCILTQINHKTNTVQLKYYQGDNSLHQVKISDLTKEYSHRYLYITTLEKFEMRSDESELFKKRKNWFWGTIWQFRHLYKQVIFSALVINLIALASPLFVMNVYDRVVPNNAIETLWVLAIGVILAYIIDFVLKTLRAYFVDAVNKKLDIVLSTQLLRKSLNTTMASQPASSGVRANHLKDFDSVRDFFGSAVLTGAVDLPFFFIFIAVIGYIGGKLCLVPLGASFIIILMAKILSGPLYHHISQTFVGSTQKTAVLFESLSSVELIKTTLSHARILDRWRRFTGKVAEESMRSKLYSVLAVNFTAFVLVMSNVIVVILGVYAIKAGDLTIGGLIGCTILTSRALAPLAQVTGLLTRVQQTRCSLAALNEVMAAEEERSEGQSFLNLDHLEGTIKFENVSFNYPGQETELLKNISFEVKEGEKVALLGNMGSGKTTLFKILLGLYKTDAGSVSINDVDINQYDPIFLRQQMSYLEQSPKLLFGSALYNIKLKHPDASDEEVLEAAKISGANYMLSRHPKGFNMQIAEQGKGLSGGQAQTIALARTLLPNSPVLLLDEPTGAMDHWAEQKFITAMRGYLQGKTMLLVTHKQSLLTLVDRIIIMQNGQVVMNDTRDKVLEAMSSPKPAGEDNGS